MSGKKDSRARDIRDFTFLVAFADADFLDDFELEVIKNLALEDGVVDDEEKKVLRVIFERLSIDQTSGETWKEIQRFRRRFNI